MQSKSWSFSSNVSFGIHPDLSDAASVEDAQETTALYIAAFDNPATGLESTDPSPGLLAGLIIPFSRASLCRPYCASVHGHQRGV